ncbi:uncharacterized protein LOC124277380 [Haliotis rubra]|uniref:uncharacterized protein LOC124277380 n=1 Tax=Haliotis rubra TaxID=36100 RepID=UPI001EE563EE|nr:uncharacterized protein LOC124277380 [Haliotis rubra]
MASHDKDSGHLVLATSRRKSEDNMATSSGQPGGLVAPSSEQPEGWLAPSSKQPEGRVALSSGQPEVRVAPSSGRPEGRVAPSSGRPEGRVAPSSGQPEGHKGTSRLRGDLPVSEVDISSSDEEYLTAEDDSGSSRVSSDEEHEGRLVLAGSAEHEEVLELENQAITLSTGEKRSGNAQVANTLNIITGGAGQGTLGRDTLDLRTDEARKIFAPTEAYRKVKQKLKEFGHVTICGASGEGKTTMALMLGSQYRQRSHEKLYKLNLTTLDSGDEDKEMDRMVKTVQDLMPNATRSGMYKAAKSLREYKVKKLKKQQLMTISI